MDKNEAGSMNETNPGTLDEATVTEFWSKVDKRSDDECWPWNGPRNNPRSGAPSGYGRIYIRRKINQAHRLSYELVHGPIPEGLVIDHLCRNPCCVNPAHLEAVSNQENVLRGTGHTARNAVKTHCVNGHPLVGDNLIARKRKFRNYAGVERNCRQCQTERKRVYRREDVANLESYKKMREIAIDALGYESILEALEAAPPAAQSQPAAKAGDARSISVAEEWAVYMDEAVSKAPEPLRQLGEYLAGLLDEDQWKTAERYLNAAALSSPASQSVEKEAAEYWREKALLSSDIALPHKEEATPAPVGEQGAVIEAAETLRKEAFLLLQNSEGCALNHYGHDAEQFGMPGWLTDSRARIEAAAKVIATPATTTTERGRG